MFRCTRTAIVLVAALMAMFVPGFGAFISLIGSLACALLAFVIPAFCHLRIFGKDLPRCADVAVTGSTSCLGIFSQSSDPDVRWLRA